MVMSINAHIIYKSHTYGFKTLYHYWLHIYVLYIYIYANFFRLVTIKEMLMT